MSVTPAGLEPLLKEVSTFLSAANGDMFNNLHQPDVAASSLREAQTRLDQFRKVLDAAQQTVSSAEKSLAERVQVGGAEEDQSASSLGNVFRSATSGGETAVGAAGGEEEANDPYGPFVRRSDHVDFTSVWLEEVPIVSLEGLKAQLLTQISSATIADVRQCLEQIGVLLGDERFVQAVICEYNAADGVQTIQLDQFDSKISHPEALYEAFQQAIHTSILRHPKIDQIAGQTYQKLVLENPDSNAKARWEQTAQAEGLDFGKNHCTHDLSVLSEILREIA